MPISQQQLSTQDHFFAPVCWVLPCFCLVLSLDAGSGTGSDSCSDTIDSESEGTGGGRWADAEGVEAVGFRFRSSDMVRGREAERKREWAPVERCGSKCIERVEGVTVGPGTRQTL